MTAGCITGLAAFVNAIKVGSVTSTSGNQLETQIMIALVLGGMPVNGGAKVKFYNIRSGCYDVQSIIQWTGHADDAYTASAADPWSDFPDRGCTVQ